MWFRALLVMIRFHGLFPCACVRACPSGDSEADEQLLPLDESLKEHLDEYANNARTWLCDHIQSHFVRVLFVLRKSCPFCALGLATLCHSTCTPSWAVLYSRLLISSACSRPPSFSLNFFPSFYLYISLCPLASFLFVPLSCDLIQWLFS
jgi:hypothetical protein